MPVPLPFAHVKMRSSNWALKRDGTTESFLALAPSKDQQFWGRMPILESLAVDAIKWTVGSALERITGRLKAFSQPEFEVALKRLMHGSNFDGELGISLGNGFFANAFLTRLLRNGEVNKEKGARIHRLTVKSISPTLVAALQSQGMLPANFQIELDVHLATWKSLCAEHRIAFESRIWTKLPPFHGFLLSNALLLNHWEVDETGQLTWITPVIYQLTKKFHLKSFAHFRALYDAS
jgi:hypothetical protein